MPTLGHSSPRLRRPSRPSPRPHPEAHELARWRAAFAPVDLSDTTLASLHAAAVLTRHDPGALPEPLFHEPAWHLLWEGRIAVSQREANGSLLEQRVVRAGEWLDITSAWPGGRAPGALSCLGPCVVSVLPLPSVLHAAGRDAQLVLALGAALSRHAHAQAQSCHDLRLKDTPARLASWLLNQLAVSSPPLATDPESAVTLDLPDRKQCVAQKIGTTAETVSRILSRWHREHLLSWRGSRMVVHDLCRLQQVAQVARSAPAMEAEA